MMRDALEVIGGSAVAALIAKVTAILLIGRLAALEMLKDLGGAA